MDLNPQPTQTTNCEQSSVNSNQATQPTQGTQDLAEKTKLVRSDCSLVTVKNGQLSIFSNE
ncbi:DNA primase [Crocosphaera watsonii WH 0003]|uniref:DNA primase n=1 Tax=Crocosphaera watsonii WH 0003 TaxID=423471 RepID=G5JEG8_CROWT|nr:DNA primase [Crocosphaera watsonii WH 0003]